MKRRDLIGGTMAAGVAAGLPWGGVHAENARSKSQRAAAKVEDGCVVNVPLDKRAGT